MKTVEIFDYTDYKVFVNDKILAMPKSGYGQYRKLAQYLNMSTVMISHIFKGERDLAPEQALKLGFFFQLSKVEREYLLVLIHWARAGSADLKQYFREKIDELKDHSKKLGQIVEQDKVMSEAQKAQFYSNWYYSALRLYSSLGEQQDISTVAERFGLPPEVVSAAFDFLLANGLCIKQDSAIKMGPARLHLEANSAYVQTRQIDWRVKGFEKMRLRSPDNLFFTAPLSISKKGAKELRQLINKFIKQTSELVVSQKPQTLRCLNIDFFEF